MNDTADSYDQKHEDEYEELLAELQRQESNAVGFDSDTIASEQIEAFERYTGVDYGNEIAGRSRVHTREVFETIEWIRPDIARMFGSGGKAVEIDPWAQGSEKQAEEATDFINQTFFEQQDGHKIVDEFFFDGALQKLGVVGVFWEDEQLGEPEEYEGLNMLQADEFRNDPNIDVLEEAEEAPSEPDAASMMGQMPGGMAGAMPPDAMMGAMGEAGPTYRMKIQRVKLQARPYVKNIAPEDFRISPRAVDLDNVPYCGHVDRTTKSELKLLFPDKEEEIDEYADSSRQGPEEDERRSTRFADEDGAQTIPNREEDDDVILHTEYLYWDKDKDGYAELIEVKRLDGCILACQPVEENPYAAWTPARIPHKLIGLSIADITKDLQLIKTTLLRGALDAVYQAVVPRTVANEKNVYLEDLLTVRPGMTIRVKADGDVNNSVRALTTPDVSGVALNMLEHVDQMAEARSGITRNAQGLDPDALNKTATGIKLMQNAASVRKEMFARNLASGLEMMFRKFYRMLVRQGQRPQILRVGKEWKTFTPSTWEAEAKVRVHVGQGTGDREVQVNQLMMLLGLQEKAAAAYGKGNPIVTPKHLHHTIEQIGRVMGFRSIDPFFADPSTLKPDQLQQLMQPAPSPEMAKVEAQTKADAAKLQGEQQLAAQRTQLEMARMDREFQLKEMQMTRELDLKERQIMAELNLKREIELAKVASGAYAQPNGIAGNGSAAVHVGGEAG